MPGYRFTSYEQGYGDMLARADWNTVRRHSVGRQDGDDHVRSASTSTPTNWSRWRRAPCCAVRWRPPRRLGFLPMVASEIEFYLFQDTYDEAHAKGYRDLQPHSPWLEDYHILQTTKDEYILGAIRRGLEAGGRAGGVLQGRGRPRPARDEPRLHHGRRDGRPQQRLQDRGQGDRPSERSLGQLHGQVRLQRHRVVVPRPLEPVVARRQEGAVRRSPRSRTA